MATGSPSLPTVQRSFAWAPTDDPVRTRGIDPGSLYGAGRPWTPFGLTALGHTIRVNVATGGLVVSVPDLTFPYHSMQLAAIRTLDVQEQYSQFTYLDTHPNTDPRFHFFGNWQFQREALISPVWKTTKAEYLVIGGDGSSSLFYRDYPDFETNAVAGPSIESRLRQYGVPGRALAALGWQNSPFDSLVRTRQGAFAILTGSFDRENMIDPVELRLWLADPITGSTSKFTSEYGYHEFIDTDGLREVNSPVLLTDVVDALGHSISFKPVTSQPPFRSYRMIDGSGRSLLFELEASVYYLDGELPGAKAKSYLVSRLTDEISAERNFVDYGYDGHRLVFVKYPGHAGRPRRTVAYTYDERGSLASIQDPLGDVFHFDYIEDLLDSDQLLIPRLKISRISDSDGNSIAYDYDDSNNKIIVTFSGPEQSSHSVDFRFIEDDGDTGQRFIVSESLQVTSGYSGSQVIESQWGYTDDGRFLIAKSLDPLGNAAAAEYNEFNQITAATDASGHKKSYTYDLQAAPSQLKPNRYDVIGISESNIDAKGNAFIVQRSQTFQSYGPASSADPNDSNQSTHRVASQTDERGEVWTFGYEDQINVLTLLPSLLKDPLQNVSRRFYNQFGQLLKEIDGEQNTRVRLYDAHGNLIGFTDANGFISSWVYDAGTLWLTDVTDPNGLGPGDPAHSLHIEWNDAGQPIRQTDPMGAVTEYAFGGNKRLRAITRFDPAARQISFRYEAAGALARITDAQGAATVFLHDEAGRLYESFRNTGGGSIRATMDLAGRVLELTDRNGQNTSYTYDPLGRVLGVQEPDWPAATQANKGKKIAITYDNLGRRLKVSDSETPSPYLYTYDAAGNKIESTEAFGSSLSFSYDPRGNLARVFDQVGMIDISFLRDRTGQIASVTDSNFLDPSRTFVYRRREGSLVDNLYRINADASRITTRFRYDPNRQIVSARHERTGTAISSFGYSYQADGVIKTVNGNQTASYSYDGSKQLIQETDTGSVNAYDGAGNRLSRNAVNAPASYDSENRLKNLPIEGVSFQYDANGNTLLQKWVSGRQAKYIFDGNNRLRSVDIGASRIDYLYNLDGLLLERTITSGGKDQTERYRYAGARIVATTDENNKVRVLYTRDDLGRLLRRRSARKLNPSPTKDPHSLFYLHDGLLSVCRLVDWDGLVRFESEYDAWGLPLATGPADPAERYGYRQGYWEKKTGLLNFGARWYDPAIGRWISQDPLLISQIRSNGDPTAFFRELVNPYLYVGNNPLNAADPSGLIDWKKWIVILEAAGRWLTQTEQSRPPRPPPPQIAEKASQVNNDTDQGGNSGPGPGKGPKPKPPENPTLDPDTFSISPSAIAWDILLLAGLIASAVLAGPELAGAAAGAAIIGTGGADGSGDGGE